MSAIDGMLAIARARLDRVRPEHLADEIAAGALIIDIRPLSSANTTARWTAPWSSTATSWNGGSTPAAHTTSRRSPTPASGSSWCANEGYSSSLAAATLRDLGQSRATDLAGGFQAWRAIVTVRESAQPRT